MLFKVLRGHSQQQADRQVFTLPETKGEVLSQPYTIERYESEQAMTPLQTAIQTVYEQAGSDDWQIAASCHGLLIGYDAKWREEQETIQLVETEKCLTAPLTNPGTGRNSRTYTLAGVLDKIAEDAGGTVLYDHKTTSDDISDPTAPYWRQLAVDSQSTHYELLALSNGFRFDAVVWDVTRKPTIRPKQISKAIRKESLETGTYFSFDLDQETLAYMQDGERENGTLFAYRLAADTLDNPEKYFARRANPRTRQQLAEYADELWTCGQMVRQAKRDDAHYRNSGACFNYGRPCQFLDLCAGNDTPESDRWQLKPKKHAELPDGIGGDSVLTNSRLRCFHTCRRKHYYQYELGIERSDADRAEALYFGSLWHSALDAWWQAMNERQCDDDYSNTLPIQRIGSIAESELVS